MRTTTHLLALLSLGAAFSPLSCQAVAPLGSSATSPPPLRPPNHPDSPEPATGVSPLSVRASVTADEAADLVGFPRFPTLSPDGKTLVFSWAGDLWSAPLPVKLPESGLVSLTAGRLTSNPADERAAAFAPDASLLAFESDRHGARNLYVMPIRSLPNSTELIAGEARRVTFSDAAQSLGSFSADGSALYFSANQEPTLYRQARLYSVSLADGQVRRLTDAQGFLPRGSKDGDALLFTRGYATLWNRPIYRGPGAIELYRYSIKGKTFTQLTRNDANDGNGFQNPDGSVIFTSSRDGQNNLWRLPPGATDESAAPEQLTHFKVPDGQVTIGHGVGDSAVSFDGSRAVFTVWDTMYLLDLTRPGAKPIAIAASVSGDSSEGDQLRLNLDKQVSEAALSPDGKTLALAARGEIFVRSTEEGRPTRRVTRTHARERDLAWSPDGKTLYFASDESGVYAIQQATVSLTRDELEPKKPAESGGTKDAGGEKPAEPTTPSTAAPAAAPSAPATNPAPAASPTSPSEPTNAAGSADPKPTAGVQPEAPPKEATSPEVKKEAKPEKIDHGKRWADSLLFDVKTIANAAGDDVRRPMPSPDGKKLAYIRSRGDLILRDLASNTDTVLLASWDEPEMIWASDSRHVIYAVQDLDYNSDLWLMDITASEPAKSAVNLTRHPDTDTSPRLSADGKVLTYLSERAGENGEFDIWQVFLDKKLEGLKPYEMDEYFKKTAEAAGKRKPLDAPSADAKPKAEGESAKSDAKADGKAAEPKATDTKAADAKPAEVKTPEPLKFDAEDAYLRVRRMTSNPGSEDDLAITPAADRVLFSATQDGDRALFSVDRKGEDKKVLQAGGVSNVTTSLTGDKAVFVRAGVASATSPKGGGKVETLAIDAPVTIVVPLQQKQKFLEAARILGTRFYHSTMKGLDWDGLTNSYLSLAMQTRTSAEFNEVVEMLFGELNGSHTGISGGGGTPPARPAVGCLGIESEPVATGYRVTHVVDDSPADQPTSKLEVGDIIVGVDGVKLIDWPRVDSHMKGLCDLSEALLGKAGKETLLEVERASADKPRYVLIVPASAAAYADLGYREGIKRRRELVEKLSGGRLGYLHIRSMNDPSVRDFERDLYAAGHGKDGLIIDVRDNGGGYTTDILLASLTAPVHAKTAPRGVDPSTVPSDTYPRDRRLIYGYAKPINVLINENSFSNAEVFAHAIKTIKRGSLVGTTTFGAVISTGAASLIDGTTVRVPGRGWWLPDGKDMENNGAQPDSPMAQRPDDDAANRDAQLDEAVRELMGRLNAK